MKMVRVKAGWKRIESVPNSANTSRETAMQMSSFAGVLVSVLTVDCLPTRTDAYGAAHVGYTRVTPTGVYHTGRTAVAGPNGVYAGGRTTAARYGGVYHAGGATAATPCGSASSYSRIDTPSGYGGYGGYAYVR
jgi:hypothetical protein